MKIDRLIGILSVLLQEKKVTAPELAKIFEVSRRTINRDIEDLCKAGIPIFTSQGAGGGISIMDDYKMDRTILSSKDMQMIMAGLRSLDSVSGSHYYVQLMEKIKAGSSDFVSGNESILIDLSSWNKDSLSPKIELIQDAIELGKTLTFQYYAPSGNTEREIEPYFLIFKWSSWYVYGYCLLRNDFRMFKLNRMTDIAHVRTFEKKRDVPMPDLSNEKVFPPKAKVKAVFEPSMKWHLIEEYGAESFTELPDGKLLFEHEYADDEGLLSWMLSLRDKVTVIEPESIREGLFRIATELTKKYKEEKKRRILIGQWRLRLKRKKWTVPKPNSLRLMRACAFRLCTTDLLMMNPQLLQLWINFLKIMDIVMTLAIADFTMKSICPMQERLLLRSGRL